MTTPGQYQGPPPPIINLSATPDGKYVILQLTCFVELDPAGKIGEALVNLTRQLRTGLIIPGPNGSQPGGTE